MHQMRLLLIFNDLMINHAIDSYQPLSYDDLMLAYNWIWISSTHLCLLQCNLQCCCDIDFISSLNRDSLRLFPGSTLADDSSSLPLQDFNGLTRQALLECPAAYNPSALRAELMGGGYEGCRNLPHFSACDDFHRQISRRNEESAAFTNAWANQLL